MLEPKQINPDLAELLGIIVGDGYVRIRAPYWLSIECSSYERKLIDDNVIPLIKSVFDIRAKGKYFNRKGIKNTCGILITSKELANSLAQFGVAVKHDVISVPKQVLDSKDRKVKSRFLRGYIDTDGCFSFIKKNNKFRYPRLHVSSVSEELMNQIAEIFRELGFRGSLWTMKLGKKCKLPLHRFEMKGNDMIKKWYDEIGTKNPSNMSKYILWSKTGECKTNTTYEDRLELLKSIGLITDTSLKTESSYKMK